MTNSGIDQSIILFLFEDNFCHGEKKYFKVNVLLLIKDSMTYLYTSMYVTIYLDTIQGFICCCRPIVNIHAFIKACLYRQKLLIYLSKLTDIYMYIMLQLMLHRKL